MRLSQRDRDELRKAICEQLHYFEPFDKYHGLLPTYGAQRNIRDEAQRRFVSDALFRAKVTTLLKRLEFVLIDSAGVDERDEREEKSIRQKEYAANVLAKVMGIKNPAY